MTFTAVTLNLETSRKTVTILPESAYRVENDMIKSQDGYLVPELVAKTLPVHGLDKFYTDKSMTELYIYSLTQNNDTLTNSLRKQVASRLEIEKGRAQKRLDNLARALANLTN